MTAPVSYLLSGTEDPEESVEERMLLDAFRRVVPDILVTSPVEREARRGTVVFGRLDDTEIARGGLAWPPTNQLDVPYWDDPAVTREFGRRVEHVDLRGAQDVVRSIHAGGRDAFLKSSGRKQFAGRIPIGSSVHAELDALCYSFIDRGPCLLAQEFVEMEHEYRLLVIDRTVVTGAGCVEHLTPRDNESLFDPKTVRRRDDASEVGRHPEVVDRYLEFAGRVVRDIRSDDYTLDLCLVDGEVRIVELNPLVPGRCGLYACDVDALASSAYERAIARIAPMSGPGGP